MKPSSSLNNLIEVPSSSVALFSRDGHACMRHLVSRAEVEYFRPALEETTNVGRYDFRALEDRDTYGKAFLQVHNLWQKDATCKQFVFARRFAHVAATLLGVEGVRLYHDQALFKEPDGGYTPWHQDQTYWPLDTDRTITMWMPLVEVTPSMGTISFVSGSHRIGNVEAGTISDTSHRKITDWIRKESLPVHTYDDLEVGDATFHNGWTLHSAGHNSTGNIRSVMTVIYVADGAGITTPTPAQQFDLELWLGGQRAGDKVGSVMNPLLYP